MELGLIDRGMGSFALDEESRGKSESGLDRMLKLEELRQLSLRDLRLLRNTIYAGTDGRSSRRSCAITSAA